MKHNLQRQIFLYSAILHIILVGSLMEIQALLPDRTPPPERAEEVREVARIVPPPASVLRELDVRPTPAPNTAPTAAPTPPPPRDRISVGAPAPVERRTLTRDESLLAKVAPGDSLKVAPTPAPGPAAAATPQPPATDIAATGERPTLPPTGPSAPPTGDGKSSLLASADRRIEALGKQGLPNATGKQIGPMFFDPEGADFTLWVEHLRTEVFRNWIVPQSASFGFGTHADFEFVVERDGRVSAANLLKSSGVPALDRAAQNALIASRPLPLPADFKSPRLVLQVSFTYNQERRS